MMRPSATSSCERPVRIDGMTPRSSISPNAIGIASAMCPTIRMTATQTDADTLRSSAMNTVPSIGAITTAENGPK